MDFFFRELWSPYLVGLGIGIVIWLTFLLSDKGLGCSTAYTRTIGMAEKMVRGERIKQKHYYREFVPEIDWGWMLVLGIVIGAFISSILSGALEIETIPRMWLSAFGDGLFSRLIIAFVGGLFVGFGARFAGGCTSGHGISGTSQLAAGSCVAFLSFFVGGIITAFLIYGAF